MAMTLRLNDDDEAAVAATAEREHTSKHEVIVRAVRAYTSGRERRLQQEIQRAVSDNAELLDRLGKA